jgi:hypothetical protein
MPIMASVDQRHVAAAGVHEARPGKGAPPMPNPTKPYTSPCRLGRCLAGSP